MLFGVRNSYQNILIIKQENVSIFNQSEGLARDENHFRIWVNNFNVRL